MKKVDDNSNHHQTWHKHSLGTLTYVYQISSNLNNPIKSYGVCLGTSGTPCIISFKKRFKSKRRVHVNIILRMFFVPIRK